jgi:hypothetical protein
MLLSVLNSDLNPPQLAIPMSAAASTSSSINREFLGRAKPALQEAALRLQARYRRYSTLDLGRVIVVVPGQRAGRRLRELLAYLAEDQKMWLTPPQLVTEGQLPEMLYTPKLPFANELVQDLVWAQALRDLPADRLQHILPHPPAAEDALRWLAVGQVLRGLHLELAADGLDFAAVHRNGQKLAGFVEMERWKALVEVQNRYLRLLDQQRLWDIQTARLKAIEFREIHTDCDIVLLGTVDLTTTLKQMLEQVAARVTAYIVASEEFADRFDIRGCLVAGAWCAAPIPLRDEQLLQVDGPEEQAQAVSLWLGALNGRYRNDEVAIGVPDESLVPQLQRQLEQCGVRVRWVEGSRIRESAPYRLLAAAVKFAGRQRYDDLAALLRHPDLEDWLQGVPPMSLPAQLDRFYNIHLPSGVSAGQVERKHKEWPDLAQAVKRIEGWLEDASGRYPLRTWGARFRKILGTVYGHRTVHLDQDADDLLHRTLCCILQECDQLSSLPPELDAMPLSATDAFQVALGPLAEKALPPHADPDAVEILGWLELPLDDSRALVVTSFNEGFVPKSAGADAFLPDRLRRELGLLHNERRYARDAYATSVLCESGKELRLLFARRDTRKDPLQPSRLIFACPDDALVRRAQQFFAEPKALAASRHLLLGTEARILDKSRFEVPRPVAPYEGLDRISVTRFRTYLACPYRYYLRHVRKLKAVDDTSRELGGGAFGKLLHRVLNMFGRDGSGPRHSDRKREIFSYLADQLDTLAREIYGADQRRPAIWLQLEQARLRLSAFAACQAELVREGWRILYAEDDEEDEFSANFLVNDEPLIKLVGRIDRIDFHEGERKVRILDYKTADTGRSPDKTHRNHQGWIDLQLPLYRHLWRAAPLTLPDGLAAELGYFNLPKQIDEAGVSVADWDEAALKDADNTAEQVIRSLRRAIFSPPRYDPVPDFNEDLAAICQDNVHGRRAFREDDDPGDLDEP